MVKRWNLVNECPNCYVDVNGSGVFTLHTDYASLERERDALQSKLDVAVAALNSIASWSEGRMSDEVNEAENILAANVLAVTSSGVSIQDCQKFARAATALMRAIIRDEMEKHLKDHSPSEYER